MTPPPTLQMFLHQALVLRQQVCLAAQRLLQLPLSPRLLLTLVHLGQALQAGASRRLAIQAAGSCLLAHFHA